MRRFVPFLTICCSPICATALPAQAHPPAAWPAAVQAFDDLIRTDSIVGGSLALVRDGRIVTRHDAGFMDRASRTPFVPQAVMHWGSITKTLTAVAILQLRDRGLLSLDDPITRWVPELRQVHNPYGLMDNITLRMVLSHSSGFQNPTWPYRQYVAWEPFEPTRWEQLVAMMPYQEILFPPGSRYGYSNPGYIYLARVIESITGDPWQSYIYKNLWLPLGFRASYFGATPPYLAALRPNNYTLVKDSSGVERVVDNGRDFDPGITIPNGGWNAPLEDLATWIGFLSAATAGDAARAARFESVLHHSTLEEMWRPITPVGSGGVESVGLGFFLMKRGGVTLVGHTGEQAGYRSFFYFNPATRTGVIGAVTTTNEARTAESGTAFRTALYEAVRLLVP